MANPRAPRGQYRSGEEMAWANERKNHNGESKKSELLPNGERAKAIIEVLAAMFRDMSNPENPTNVNAKEKDAPADKDGQEQPDN
jgi:hypothetical protein